ncbi:hypothetical protein DH2020_023057 [Rehmannia glutinosa]|uniref:Uncharacterized protein n=1 Tax=Rehmannia glutinosa TaxID=99300 RepID=A0ABR0W8R2_REHGL
MGKSTETKGGCIVDQLIRAPPSIVTWDKNAKFFHASTIQRQKRNTIDYLIDREGIKCDSQELIEKEVTSFYKDLFTANTPTEDLDILFGLPRRLKIGLRLLPTQPKIGPRRPHRPLSPCAIIHLEPYVSSISHFKLIPNYLFHCMQVVDSNGAGLDKFGTRPLRPAFDLRSSCSSFRFSSKVCMWCDSIPISAGMTASAPYTRLNGVSPVASFGVILYDNRTDCSSSTQPPPTLSNLA